MKKNTHFPIHAGPLSQRGLSLIELMISIVIGLVILASLSSMFINQSRARAELDKSNRMIDNGRYALELLSTNIRLAGFFGAYTPTGTPGSLPDPCDTATMVDPALNIDLLLVHVQGYDTATATGTIASPPCSLGYATSDNNLKLKDGSDILVVRRANTSTITQAAAAAAAITQAVYLQISSCQYDDPATSAYRMSADPGNLTLGQRNITGTNNCVSAGGITNIGAPFADLRQLVVEAYFVSPNNNAGDGIPTLKRREFTSNGFVTTPLVEGIEYMQVEYGVDTDGNGAPDTSCTTCTLAQWPDVVSAKLYLVSRNIEETKGHSDAKTYSLGTAGTVGPFHDTYKRHAYTQLVRLVNPSGRRE